MFLKLLRLKRPSGSTTSLSRAILKLFYHLKKKPLFSWKSTFYYINNEILKKGTYILFLYHDLIMYNVFDIIYSKRIIKIEYTVSIFFKIWVKCVYGFLACNSFKYIGIEIFFKLLKNFGKKRILCFNHKYLFFI